MPSLTKRRSSSRNGFALKINQHRICLVYFSDPIVFHYPPVSITIINYTYLFICYLLGNKLFAINSSPSSFSSLSLTPFSALNRSNRPFSSPTLFPRYTFSNQISSRQSNRERSIIIFVVKFFNWARIFHCDLLLCIFTRRTRRERK